MQRAPELLLGDEGPGRSLWIGANVLVKDLGHIYIYLYSQAYLVVLAKEVNSSNDSFGNISS